VFKHILCPIDGSETSIHALQVAANLAAEQHAKLTICTVADPAKAASMAFGDPGMSAACYDALDAEGKVMTADAAARIANITQAQPVALDGQPIETIVDYAATNACDLIVMGSHGRTGLSRALLGSVAEGVVCHAGTPVLIVRWPVKESKTESTISKRALSAPHT
jgi:nucleotide-binding universal stress UspA family protein